MYQQTVLFFTNSELGQASLCLAVAHEFLLRPSCNVHIASFTPLHDAISQLDSRAVNFLSFSSSPSARQATFHAIPGLSMRQTLEQNHHFDPSNAFNLHGVGFHAASQAYRTVLSRAVAPWSGEKYMAIYQGCVAVLRNLDPAMVVLDPLFPQAIDACRSLKVKYVVLSPNTSKEHVAQPRLGNLWRYPMVCSGYPYPLSWWLILPNTILAFRLLSTLKTCPQLKEVERCRNAHGVPGPIPDMIIRSNDENILACLLPGRPECEFPCHVPGKFTFCGPILRPCAPVADENPALALWLVQRPTVLVNLGTIAQFSPAMEREFAKGLRVLLDVRPDIQVLWKLPRAAASGSDSVITDPKASASLSSVIENERLRTESWLPVEPICILQSGYVECIVHHGGSNTYHEAIKKRAGIPQIILPIWFDAYDFAHRIEYLGVGIWGNRQNAPTVHGDELGDALKRVLNSGHAQTIKQKARKIPSQLGDKEGRVVACEKIMDLMPRRKVASGWEVSFGPVEFY